MKSKPYTRTLRTLCDFVLCSASIKVFDTSHDDGDRRSRTTLRARQTGNPPHSLKRRTQTTIALHRSVRLVVLGQSPLSRVVQVALRAFPKCPALSRWGLRVCYQKPTWDMFMFAWSKWTANSYSFVEKTRRFVPNPANFQTENRNNNNWNCFHGDWRVLVVNCATSTLG